MWPDTLDGSQAKMLPASQLRPAMRTYEDSMRILTLTLRRMQMLAVTLGVLSASGYQCM